MTISSTTAKNTYTGDGATLAFPFTFRILDEDHLLVQLKNTTTGVITTQTITTHYTVSGTGNDTGLTNYTSGDVDFVTEPTSSEQVIIIRAVPILQETDYTENDPFPAETHEEALDELTMIAQELNEKQDRALILDPSVTGVDTTISFDSSTDGDKFLKVNADGDGFEVVNAPSSLSGVTVPQGGTGVTSLTDGGILLGSGIGAITALGVATNGQIPIGDGTGDPVLGTITGGTNINVTNGAGSITVNSALNVVQTVDVTNRSTTSTSYTTTGITAAITPAATSSKVLITCSGILGGSAGNFWDITFFRDAVDLTPAGVDELQCLKMTGGSADCAPFSIALLDSPSTTSEVTYSLQFKVNANTVYVGRRGADTSIDSATILTVTEIPN